MGHNIDPAQLGTLGRLRQSEVVVTSFDEDSAGMNAGCVSAGHPSWQSPSMQQVGGPGKVLPRHVDVCEAH
jgi:hypothetical protein